MTWRSALPLAVAVAAVASALIAWAFHVVTHSSYTEVDAWLRVGLHFDDVALLHDERSEVQRVQVYRHRSFGNILVLDGDLMLTSRDHFSYHEMMVHVPMALLGPATQVRRSRSASDPVAIPRRFPTRSRTRSVSSWSAAAMAASRASCCATHPCFASRSSRSTRPSHGWPNTSSPSWAPVSTTHASRFVPRRAA